MDRKIPSKPSEEEQEGVKEPTDASFEVSGISQAKQSNASHENESPHPKKEDANI